MPSGDVAVLDQKHASGAVDNDGTDAERQPARETPIEVKEPPKERLEQSAERFKIHSDIAVSARLTSGRGCPDFENSGFNQIFAVLTCCRRRLQRKNVRRRHYH